jgi:hypothetical protein
MVMEIAVLGSRITSNLLYPNFTLVQQIHITDFLDRVDLFMLGIWFFIISTKCIFTYLALLIAVQSFSKQTTYQLFNKPCALFVLITCTLAFRSVGSLFNFGNYGAIVIVLTYQPIVFLFLVLRAKMKRKIGQIAGAKDDALGDTQTGEQGGGQTGERPSGAEKKTLHAAKAWGRATNMALLAAFAFLGLGLMLGHVDAIYGKIACIGCGLSLLSLWLTTHKEMKWSVRSALK